MTSSTPEAHGRPAAHPDLESIRNNVRLGATVDGHLEELGEFRPGEAWSDCAERVHAQDPELAAWLRRADRRWAAIEQAEAERGQ